MSQAPACALAAAALFGASTPLAKLLLGNADTVALASVLYLGSGIGLAFYRAVAGERLEAKAQLGRGEITTLLPRAYEPPARSADPLPRRRGRAWTEVTCRAGSTLTIIQVLA